MSSFAKYQGLQQVKKEWKKYKTAKRHEDFLYTEYLEVLPQDVHHLPAEYYLSAFPQENPVRPRLPMDDLLMAVGGTRMRWPKDQPTEPESKGKMGEMNQLLEFAFRMGRTASLRSDTPSTSSSAAPGRPPFPLLALEDDPNRRLPQEPETQSALATEITEPTPVEPFEESVPAEDGEPAVKVSLDEGLDRLQEALEQRDSNKPKPASQAGARPKVKACPKGKAKVTPASKKSRLHQRARRRYRNKVRKRLQPNPKWLSLERTRHRRPRNTR